MHQNDVPFIPLARFYIIVKAKLKASPHTVRNSVDLLTVKSGIRKSFRLDQIELRTETQHVQKGLRPES